VVVFLGTPDLGMDAGIEAAEPPTAGRNRGRQANLLFAAGYRAREVLLRLSARARTRQVAITPVRRGIMFRRAAVAPLQDPVWLKAQYSSRGFAP